MDQIPQFWQGVVASLMAAIIFAIIASLLRFSFSSIQRLSHETNNKKERLKRLLSGNDLDKPRAVIILILHMLRWLFIGNMLWILSGSVEYFLWGLGIEIVQFIKFFLTFTSIMCFYLGLRWVVFFTRFER